MKYSIYLLLLSLTFFSCSNQDPEEKLQNLNGYWEVEKVEFPDESVKEFKMSETVDFFGINNKKGIRKKVKPQFDGTYLVTEDAENVEVRIENDSLNLYYFTPYDSWKETVLKAGEEKMSIINNRGITYHYKRFVPLLSALNEKEK